MAQPVGNSTSKAAGQSVALTNFAQSSSGSSGSWLPFQLSGKISQLWNSFIQSAFADDTELHDTGFQTFAIPSRATVTTITTIDWQGRPNMHQLSVSKETRNMFLLILLMRNTMVK